MKTFIGYSILMSCMLLCMACNRNLDRALQQAGDNRAEMEKVLVHFKDDPDPLKYRAAKFLIENMPYHYTYEGKAIEAYDSIYLQMADEPLPERNHFFKERTDNIRFSDQRFATDIQTVKADYLIRAIDEACDTWRRSSWTHGDAPHGRMTMMKNFSSIMCCLTASSMNPSATGARSSPRRIPI